MKQVSAFSRILERAFIAGLAYALLTATEAARSEVVITNTPSRTPGGSTLFREEAGVLLPAPKWLIFTTGNIPSQINSLTLGIQPRTPTTPLPLSTSLGASIWSTTNDSPVPLPLSELTTTQPLDFTIYSSGQLYEFNANTLGSVSSFTLNPNSTYGLAISSLVNIPIANQPKWSSTGNTGDAWTTAPSGQNGFTYRGFAITKQDGSICTAENSSSPSCGTPWNVIILDVSFLGITPGMTTDASDPASSLLSGGTVIVDQSGTFATDYALAPLGGTIDINGLISSFSGIFSGHGPLSFSNSSSGGSTTLTSASTYTGATTVGQGATLTVNGSIASSSELTVQSGGTIGGNGQLPGTTIAAGAVMAPGNSIGKLTVNGNYSLNGGTLALELQGPKNDQIVVTGNIAPFSGNAALISYGGGTAWPGFSYKIITANNAFATPNSLTLDQFQITPSAILQLGTTLAQEADGNPSTFDVQWRPNNGSGAVTSALQTLDAANGNGSAAAGVFDAAFNRLASTAAGNAHASGALIGSTGFTADQASAAGLSSEFVTRLAALLGITSGSQLQQAVNSISPESYAAFQSVGLNALRLQREILSAQAGSCQDTGWVINSTGKRKGSANSMHPEKSKTPLCVFATGGNATSSINGRDGLSSYGSAIAGGFYGVEVQPNKQWTVGAAYGHGTAALSHLGASSNSVSATVNSGSLYGLFKSDGDWTIQGLLGYGNYSVHGLRRLIAVGNGNAISGSATANGYTAGLHADYAIPLSKANAKLSVVLKPQLGLAYGAYQQAGFDESGDPTMNLTVASHTSQSLVGTVGAEVVAAIPLNPAKSQVIKPRLAVAYQVDALANSHGNRSLYATLPAAGASFTSTGENRGANDLTISGTLEYVVANKASLYASASYEVFSTGSQFAYGGGLKLSF